MIAFTDDQRGAYGVEPICQVLPLTPSTYFAAVARRSDPAKAPARVRRDVDLKVVIRRVFEANYRVYGVRKVWRQLCREGHDVARCTVARLMRPWACKAPYVVSQSRQHAATRLHLVRGIM